MRSEHRCILSLYFLTPEVRVVSEASFFGILFSTLSCQIFPQVLEIVRDYCILQLGDMRATPAATLQNECASGKKPAGADENAVLPYARNLLEFVVAMVMEQGLEGIQSQDCQLKLELDTLKVRASSE